MQKSGLAFCPHSTLAIQYSLIQFNPKEPVNLFIRWSRIRLSAICADVRGSKPHLFFVSRGFDAARALHYAAFFFRLSLRMTLWASANNSATARTFFIPRTLNCCSPRFLDNALTHSAVAARSL
jgi:hypothetical protein